MTRDEIIKKIVDELIINEYISEIYRIISDIYIEYDIKNTEYIARISIGRNKN